MTPQRRFLWCVFFATALEVTNWLLSGVFYETLPLARFVDTFLVYWSGIVTGFGYVAWKEIP